MAKFKNTKFAAAILVLPIVFLIALSSGSSDDKNLQKLAGETFGTLPKSIVSEKNPITPQKVKLGKILFYETRISVDGTASCVRCHPFGLYAADHLKKSIGNNCKVNARNAPTILNAASQFSEHWIGNRTNVEDQAKQSVTGNASFGMPSYESVEKILRANKEYVTLFKDAFPEEKDPVNIDNFAKAVGAFERTLVTPSSFDNFLNGNTNAITDHQKNGLKIFIELGCSACHSGPYFGGKSFRKFGIAAPYWKYTKSEPVDNGRYDVTKEESDKFVFKVPMLRNVEKTAPYFHDGSVEKLADAVQIMAEAELGTDLNNPRQKDLIAFLQSLTGRIPQDALTVPILPTGE